MSNELIHDANDERLEDVLFSNNRKYRVPRYQREYTWKLEDASEFWDDLVSSDGPYFLGSFIFNVEEEATSGYRDIIDGQQRLITITILCAVLRDHAKALSDTDKAKLIQRHDIAIEDKNGKQDYRIIPSDSLLDYFKKNIQSEQGDILSSVPKKTEERRIYDVYKFFYERVNDLLLDCLSIDSKINKLIEIRNKLYDLMIINIEISHEEAAYEIFETTNATGVDLSVGDLLKNLIFKNIPEKDNKDIAKEIWEQITSNIESTGSVLKQFIRYFWISRYKFVTDKKVYKEIKKNITDWQGLLHDLWSDSILYNKMIVGELNDFTEYKRSDRIYDSLFAFRIMGVSQIYILLLSIFRNYKKLKTDPTNLIEFLENFTFQYSVVCKQPANYLEKKYANYALEIEKAVTKFSEKEISAEIQRLFSNLKKDLLSHLPNYVFFEDRFMEISYRNSEPMRMLIKYIFSKFEKFYAGPDRELRIDYPSINIEHLLPQHPSSEWGLDENEIKEYVNLLGNLIIISKHINGRVQNKLINEKLSEYRKSQLEITKQLVKKFEEEGTEWNKEKILQRQKKLAEIAYKSIWKCQI